MKLKFSMLAAIFFMAMSCNAPKDQSEKRVISVSILPQKYFIEALAGDEFDVNVLLPPGTGHGSYDPTPKQFRDINKSDLYFKIGYLGFELAWMDAIKKNHKNLKVIDLSAGITLLEGEGEEHGHGDDDHGHDHGGIDPHIWMSPKSAIKIAENTASALIMYDPAIQDMISQSLDSLKARIMELDQQMEEVSANLTNKKFIIYHPALSYLARDYGMEQIALEFEGKNPSAAHLKELIDVAKAENIKIVFIQKEFDKENAKQISKDINAQLIQIDPLAEDWEKQMREVIESFRVIQGDSR